MIEEPEAHASRHRAEAELLARPQHDLRAQPRQMGRAGRSRPPGSRARSRGWRPRRSSSARPRRSRARAPGTPRSVPKFTPASAPAPSGRSLVDPSTNSKPARVAPEHPEVREQVMREVHRLGALQVRVAGHRPVEVTVARAARGRSASRCSGLERLQRVRAGEHRHVGRDLVVARARRVQLAADRADDLGQPALDGHVDVLVGVVEAELAVLELAARRARARSAARRGRRR